MSEPRIPHHRFYQKQNHVKLAREDKDKSVIRDSGLARIDGVRPPVNLVPPDLIPDFSSEQYVYRAGDWGGVPFSARTFINDVDVGEATVFIRIQPAWFGSTIQVKETATDPVSGLSAVAVSPSFIVPPVVDGRDIADLPAGNNGTNPQNIRARINAYRMGAGGGVADLESHFSTNNAVRFARNVVGFETALSSPGDNDFFLSLGLTTSGQEGEVHFLDANRNVVTVVRVADQTLAPTQLSPVTGASVRSLGGLEFGAFFRDGLLVFADVPTLNLMGAMGATTAWTPGQFITALDGPAHWDGAAWASGPASNLSLTEQVEAILAGTGGFALDARDLSTMFQNEAGTVPVTGVGQSVARLASKFGKNSYAFTQPATASMLALTVDGLSFDGIDDFLLINNPTPSFSRAAPALFTTFGFTPKGAGALFAVSTPTSNQTRFNVTADAAGVVSCGMRRPDATGFTRVLVGQNLTYNAPAVLSVQADAAGQNDVRAWFDGVAVAPQPMDGAAAPFSDTSSARTRLGALVTNGSPAPMTLRRMIVCPFEPTDAQRLTFEAWVAEVA